MAPARTSRSAQKPTRRVGGDAGERIAAAALQANHQLARRHRFAHARVQALEVQLRGRHDRVDHRHEADVALILQADDVEPGSAFAPTSATLRSSAIAIVPGGSSRSGCSFSQPRLTTITSPPKFGFRLMLRSVRIGISAPGASIATPQP